MRVGYGISGTNILSIGRGMSVGGGGGVQPAPSWGSLIADSSGSDLLAGYDSVVAVHDGATYQYYGLTGSTWKLLWVDTTGALLRGDMDGATAVTVASGASSGPFATSYGIATDRLAGSVSAGQAFSHEADFIGEFTVPALANTGHWRFRLQDSANGWSLQWGTNGVIVLYEVVDGTFTNRGQAAGVLSNGSRVVVVADGNTIRIYTDNTLRITYSSASNFVTETFGVLATPGTGGVVSDLIAWPRTISGQAKAWLDAVA